MDLLLLGGSSVSEVFLSPLLLPKGAVVVLDMSEVSQEQERAVFPKDSITEVKQE